MIEILYTKGERVETTHINKKYNKKKNEKEEEEERMQQRQALACRYLCQ